MSHRRKVYVIDDDEAMRILLNFLLSSATFNVKITHKILSTRFAASTLAA